MLSFIYERYVKYRDQEGTYLVCIVLSWSSWHIHFWERKMSWRILSRKQQHFYVMGTICEVVAYDPVKTYFSCGHELLFWGNNIHCISCGHEFNV